MGNAALYMAPEQAEGKPSDCRADIYSFGETCYHMLRGRAIVSGRDGRRSRPPAHFRPRLRRFRTHGPICRLPSSPSSTA